MITFSWAVIGAGPAGIAAVGKLIDSGIDPATIAWIDPNFQVGDFGTKWHNVSSNTKVALFLKFFTECNSFNFANISQNFAITKIDPHQTCLLALAAQPLQWITKNLSSQVHTFTASVQHLKCYDRQWHLTLANLNIAAKNVILATGAEPKSLALAGVTEILLTTALDPEKLPQVCASDDVIAVFGSSHSAILILQTLVTLCDVKQIINYYLSPLRYALYLEDWILFDDTGLKGNTAQWARDHIDGTLPHKLQRIISTEENLRVTLPLCTKAIYATGFQQRLIPIEGMHSVAYNDRSGIIAPGLFGLGIAFPEAKRDRYGNLEYRVGLWKFMEYLNHIMPVWLKYGI